MPTNSSVTVFSPKGYHSNDILNKKGAVVGERTVFSSQSAAELKARLKASGLKGAALSKQVNSVLRGETDVRWMLHDAKLSVLRSQGAIPDYVDTRKSVALSHYLLPKAEKAKSGGARQISDAEWAEFQAFKAAQSANK